MISISDLLEWVSKFEEVLSLSKLSAGETVLIFTDTEYPYLIITYTI